MAEEHPGQEHRPEQPAAGDEGSPSDGAALEPAGRDWTAWSNLWQIPTIVVGGLLIVLGISIASRQAPQNDFDGALDQVERLIAASQFETAAARLNDDIGPHLALASDAQRARFHAISADWIALSERAAGIEDPDSSERLAREYGRAVELGLALRTDQLERWATALVDQGRIEEARERLAELDAAVIAGDDAGARGRRNRVLRALVERALREPELSFDELLRILVDYRDDPMLAASDQLWAVAREAELRLERGTPGAAIDRLLVDMRRIEERLPEDATASFGELYVLLGRGYYDLGQYDRATFHLDRALAELGPADPGRATALLLLGRIAQATGELDEALELFDAVVRDFATTDAALAARLGRAEVRSVLGEHARSLADYEAIGAALPDAGPRRDVTPRRVAESLRERHDAAVATRDLDTALKYILLAETFAGPDEASGEILSRVASVSAELGRRRLGDGDPEDVDPAVRHEANLHFRRAGEYYVRYARRLTGTGEGDDDAWATALWLAADSYDLGGWHGLAIRHFNEYLAGRPTTDPRRSAVTFRLAQAHHARLELERAAELYETVIAEHPRSRDASASHVPLARAAIGLDRPEEAERHLLTVVSGEQFMTPEAMEYRDALIELGQLYYDTGRYAEAIERLTDAAIRYPDDERADEVMYRLADSYRRSALAIRDRLADDAASLSRAERERLDALRIEHLQKGWRLFDDVIASYDAIDGEPADPTASEFRRLASLYRADCAFELGEYEEAIELYDQTARRYSRDDASMQALIQIVNCYSELQDLARARTAHTRALARLRQLPDDVFSDPGTLMSREAWERWLANSPVSRVASP